jgi:hypothetical protein
MNSTSASFFHSCLRNVIRNVAALQKCIQIQYTERMYKSNGDETTHSKNRSQVFSVLTEASYAKETKQILPSY